MNTAFRRAHFQFQKWAKAHKKWAKHQKLHDFLPEISIKYGHCPFSSNQKRAFFHYTTQFSFEKNSSNPTTNVNIKKVASKLISMDTTPIITNNPAYSLFFINSFLNMIYSPFAQNHRPPPYFPNIFSSVHTVPCIHNG